ncbi:hypothetical protein [Flavobacterium cheniae]|uniref:Uncharacterized protein n=1 Tax=Flavobacterium cheniae TaxID=295428 RepID=A0A562KM73_9FLAO|nr:hypothetical protein [Flavobacterium cheniae]TDR24362.1 hypothetical protein C8D80_1399 [Flavobacterium cheniae]TWH96481.1 hypothetical protein IP97_01023 [Flavobacterium cheniae]
MSDLKERRLKSLDYQIQELENRPNYYKKYWLRLIVIGILVTLIAPEYTAKNAKNLIYYFDYNYPLCYSVVAFSYVVICAIMLLTFTIQDKKKLKKLKEKRDFNDLFRG